jgi:uncharacterized protein (TIGR03118 family)
MRRLTRQISIGAVTGSVAALMVAVPVTSAAGAGPHPSHRHAGPAIIRRNLVSDQPGRARHRDPSLVNAWGLSHGPNTPLWVSDNGTDVSTLYAKSGASGKLMKVPLTVKIPRGAPTGQVFNTTKGFHVPGTGKPALFIFDSENGVLAAWNQSVSPLTSAVKVAQSRRAVYKGLALVHTRSGPRLLATDFHHGRIDVYNRNFHRLRTPKQFRDHSLPRGYAPFNVAALRGHVYVSYAKQDAARHDDVKGRGHGFVDVFTVGGKFVKRLISRGALNSPWGLTLAPRTFGPWAGKLLVGNFGNGRIHAYRPRTGAELGSLRNTHGRPIVIDGLWALLPGGPMAGGVNTLWFSAGPDGESHGLLGTLTAR